MLAWSLLILLKIHVDSILLLILKHRMEAICYIQSLFVSYHLNAFSLQRCCRLFKRCEDVSALKFYGNSLVVPYKSLLYFFLCMSCIFHPSIFVVSFTARAWPDRRSLPLSGRLKKLDVDMSPLLGHFSSSGMPGAGRKVAALQLSLSLSLSLSLRHSAPQEGDCPVALQPLQTPSRNIFLKSSTEVYAADLWVGQLQPNGENLASLALQMHNFYLQ